MASEYPPVLVVTTVCVPGANRSTEVAPYPEKPLTVSAAVEAPTLIRFQSVRLAG